MADAGGFTAAPATMDGRTSTAARHARSQVMAQMKGEQDATNKGRPNAVDNKELSCPPDLSLLGEFLDLVGQYLRGKRSGIFHPGSPRRCRYRRDGSADRRFGIQR